MQTLIARVCALPTLLLGISANAQTLQNKDDAATASPQANHAPQSPVVLPPPPVVYIPPVALRPLPPAPPAPPPPTPKSLSGYFLYVYSFLDIREREYTSKVLNQFDTDLNERLSDFKVASKVWHSRQSGQRQDEYYSSNSANGRESRSVPVNAMIARNFADERAMHARFRLIVFPSSFTTNGVWRFYKIRFVLMDALTGRQVWEYMYSGQHMAFFGDNGDGVGRSKKILDKVFDELKARGLI